MIAGNKWYAEPGNNFMTGLNSLTQSFQEYGKIKREEEEKASKLKEIEDAKKEVSKAYKSGDLDSINEAMLNNPGFAGVIEKAMKFKDFSTKENYLQSALAFRQDPSEENAERITLARQKYLRSKGVPAENSKETDSFLERFKANPDEAIKSLDTSIAMLATKDQWDAYKDVTGITGEDKIKPLTPLGKLNHDLKNNQITEEQYKSGLNKIMKGETKQYAPSTSMKMLTEYDSLVDKYGEDHWKTKAMREKIEGLEVIELTPEEVDLWGAWSNITGKLPTIGRGEKALVLRSKILKSAASQALKGKLPGSGGEEPKDPLEAAMNTIVVQADTKSIQTNLNFLEKQAGSLKSFIRNISHQIDRVSEISKKVGLADTRLLNIPLRALKKKVQGDPSLSKYDIYIAEIEREITKVASNATQSVAAPPVEEINRWEELVDRNLSISDMLEVLEELKNAGAIREESVNFSLEFGRQKMKNRVTIPGTEKTEPTSTKSWKDYK